MDENTPLDFLAKVCRENVQETVTSTELIWMGHWQGDHEREVTEMVSLVPAAVRALLARGAAGREILQRLVFDEQLPHAEALFAAISAADAAFATSLAAKKGSSAANMDSSVQGPLEVDGSETSRRYNPFGQFERVSSFDLAPSARGERIFALAFGATGTTIYCCTADTIAIVAFDPSRKVYACRNCWASVYHEPVERQWLWLAAGDQMLLILKQSVNRGKYTKLRWVEVYETATGTCVFDGHSIASENVEHAMYKTHGILAAAIGASAAVLYVALSDGSLRSYDLYKANLLGIVKDPFRAEEYKEAWSHMTVASDETFMVAMSCSDNQIVYIPLPLPLPSPTPSAELQPDGSEYELFLKGLQVEAVDKERESMRLAPNGQTLGLIGEIWAGTYAVGPNGITNTAYMGIPEQYCQGNYILGWANNLAFVLVLEGRPHYQFLYASPQDPTWRRCYFRDPGEETFQGYQPFALDSDAKHLAFSTGYTVRVVRIFTDHEQNTLGLREVELRDYASNADAIPFSL